VFRGKLLFRHDDNGWSTAAVRCDPLPATAPDKLPCCLAADPQLLGDLRIGQSQLPGRGRLSMVIRHRTVISPKMPRNGGCTPVSGGVRQKGYAAVRRRTKAKNNPCDRVCSDFAALLLGNVT
jgi:hypothetical protein